MGSHTPYENGVTDVDPEREELIRAAVRESEDNLTVMEERLVALESSSDAELINEIFRAIHNVKGLARMAGFRQLSELAHVTEELLQRLRDGRLLPSKLLVTMLLASVDALRDLLAAAAAGNGNASSATAPTAIRAAAPVATVAGADGTRSLRVELRRLDRVIDLLGEIIIARARLDLLLERPETAAQAREAHHDAERLHANLRDQLMDLRMVPLGPSLKSFERTVRDVSASIGKVVSFSVEAEGVEIDATLVDKLRDPLMHIVRNAVDHGIETPDDRKKAGKNPAGRLVVRSHREGSTIVVEISDDGRGLRRTKLLAKARQLGLVADLAEPTDAELWQLIMHPGFSTADKVTDISGRGVGMDVVRKNVETLRGEIGIRSAEGQGTTFSLRIPMTLAIISGFRFSVADEVFVVPVEQVAECGEYHLADHQGDGACGVMNLRGQAIPCLRLRALFGMPESTLRPAVLIVRQPNGLLAVVVDRLLGESQTVVKPLGRLAKPGGPVSGSTLLGSGRVALVLDAMGMLKAASGGEAAGWRTAS
jgi:two-component system chemotaxis sensor kinase CheA